MKTLREALRSEELTLTAELSLGPRHGPDSMIEQARVLAAETDAIQIPDHRHARSAPIICCCCAAPTFRKIIDLDQLACSTSVRST